ncbi:uncharacterized protein LOC111353407 [Spodoptera litura]|uniref:Uncharacterized protein LOC111353407 n=1 Tax=Spodoptera litura TaxID=69820 RepID=A0A9J7E5B3_SPOLT|nr:uncharacterized protein LOC111353407 [Spodoptera litura]
MAGPAVTDRSFIKFKNNNQAKNKKTTIARKRSKMSDADYMAYVASAIEDGLDKMTQHIKNRDFEKLYSDMISSPTKAARKERSKFLEKKPLFPKSFDKKFAYKNSSSYLDSKPPHIQKNEFRTSTPKADSVSCRSLWCSCR